MITPAQLDRLISAGEIWMRISGHGLPCTDERIVQAREEDGWIYLAAAPVNNDEGPPWISPEAFAQVMVRGPRGLEPAAAGVSLGPVTVSPGRAVLAVVGLCLQAETASATVADREPCRWATMPGPCVQGCPVPKQYPCPDAKDNA